MSRILGIFCVSAILCVCQISEVQCQIKSANIKGAELRQRGMHQKFFPEVKYEEIDWEKRLKLNEVQKEQLNAIYAETKPRTLEIMKQIENAHKELNKIRQEEEEKIRLILNEKQLQKFDKHRMRKAKQYRLEKPKVKEKRKFFEY